MKAGANVNDPGGTDCGGITALHDAAANGHLSVIQLLLENGADANLLTKDGETALGCLKIWKDKIDEDGGLSNQDLLEYTYVQNKLSKRTTVRIAKSKKFKKENSLKALIDDDERDFDGHKSK